ncbi:MAG: UDP-N-acetylmuramate dehydrogenase [Bacilli bacterium]
MEIIKELKKLKCGKVIKHPVMKNYTTYKVGGKVTAIIYPTDIDCLIRLLKFLQNNDYVYKILGNGSNVIFKDCSYNLVIIKLTCFDKIKITGNTLEVGAGYNLIALSLKALRASLTGLEFASGIPGTVGGAVFMNAGAYKSDMGYIVTQIKVLNPAFKVEIFTNDMLNFHYRTSFLKTHPDYICLEVTIKLRRGHYEAIKEVIIDRKGRRLASQPLNFPSAGSVFRNPDGYFAGKLIEDIGYKGKMIGGALVSLKHANFIVNANNASGEDIIALINLIKKKVKEEYDIDLYVEQEIIK